jgi:transposase-like protein
MAKRPCLICTHPQREEIEKAIQEGATLNDVAARFNIGKSTVHKHRTQCQPQMFADTLEKRKALPPPVASEAAAITYLEEMVYLIEKAKGVITEAENKKDIRTMLSAIETVGRMMTDLGKLSLIARRREQEGGQAEISPENRALLERIENDANRNDTVLQPAVSPGSEGRDD